MTRTPVVSAVMIFFNMERFIAEAVESVLAQTFQDWELLLVDDGSTDESAVIAKKFVECHSDRIKYVEHPRHRNRGAAASRNLGVRLARGKFVAFIDADDVWMPSKLAEQLCIMEGHPEVGMVCGSARYWSSWAGGDDRVVPTGHQQEAVIFPPDAILALYPLGTASAPCPSDLLMRRRTVVSLGGFEEQFVGSLQLYEDQAFLAKLFLAAPVYFARQTWLNYRQHPNSCVATVTRDGHYEEVRSYFLDWFKQYLELRPVDQRVTIALQQAMRRGVVSPPKATALFDWARRAVRRVFASNDPNTTDGAPI